MASSFKRLYRFGVFTIDLDQKALLRQNKPVALTPKAFDTLVILVENSGRLVQRQELMKELWPDSFVEESNLTFNVLQLRKALTDDARKPQYIETVPRRGYRFIAPVEQIKPGLSESERQLDSPDPRSRTNGQELSTDSTLPLFAKTLSTPTTEADLPITAAAPASGRGFRRLRTTHLIAGLAAFAVVLFLVISVLLKSRGSSNDTLGELLTELPLKLEKLTGTGDSKYVAISPDGKYLAYTRGFVYRQAIWLRQLATNTNTQIVTGDDIVFGLSFARSGEYIYFVKGNPSSLYRVSLLGDAPVKILDYLEGKFSVSPDDRYLAYVRKLESSSGSVDYALMIADADGTNERTLIRRRYPDGLSAPVWMPDGKSIICAAGSTTAGTTDVRLVEIAVADGTLRDLSDHKFTNIGKIVWLSDTELILSAVKSPEDNRQLWRASYPALQFKKITAGSISYSDLSATAKADKIVATQTTRASDVWVAESRTPLQFKRVTPATDNFCWTPDQKLAYASRASGNYDLWVVRPDGSEQRQLTVNAATDGTPVSTADGRYIVFISNRAGAFQIWRMNADGGNPLQLTTGGGKNFPAVTPDGKWVLYNATDDWTAWRSSIDGGEPARLTDYPAYFPAVSPDGKTVACLGKGDSKAAILIVPIEGGQPLLNLPLRGEFAGTRFQWTADGQALIYVTQSKGVTELIKQSLTDKGVEKIATFEDELFDFGYSFDGRLLAVTRGGWQHDIMLISDLKLP